MIGNGTGKELIDQAFFAFQGGLTIVASSLSSNDEELKWLARLRQHVRLQNHPETRLPPHALSYFLFSPEEAAVLRRVNRGDSVGRNNSHVLIGSPQVLTARVALGLEMWPGWQADPPENRTMSRLQPGELDCEFEPAEQFRAQVRDKPGALERVLGWLLEKPDWPLSIIGCPAEDRVALLWGLLELGAPDLASRGVGRDWTFSTYETDHGDAIKYLPATVCLPARPLGTSVARRTSVDLTRGEPVPPPAANRARTLVAQYIRGGPALAGHGGPAPAERDRFAPADPAQVPAQGPQQASAPVMPTSAAPDPAGSSDLVGMVRSLMGAQYLEDFQDRLSMLERHAVNGLTRAEIRVQLDSDNYGITQINQLFPSHADREAAFKRIIYVAFGWELVDFKNPVVRQYVTKLIEQRPTDEFIRTLLQTAEKHNRDHQIVPSAGQHSPGQQKSTDLDQARGARPEPTPAPGTNERSTEPNRPVSPGSPAGPVRRVRRVLPAPVEILDKYKKLSVSAGWILAVMLSFVFGLFAGGFFTSDPATVAAPAPSPPESAPAASDPTTPGPAAADRPDVAVTRIDKDQLTVKPKDQLPEGAQLWLLVARSDGAMFPQPKQCLPERDGWECTQIRKFPDAATNDYPIVLVIVDQEAANSLAEYGNKHPEGTPGDGIKELPPGAKETKLIPTVSSQ